MLAPLHHYTPSSVSAILRATWTALETALVSASIAAVVSVSVAVFSPLLTHQLWKRQKRKEQQLAVAERFAAVSSEFVALARFDTGDFHGRLPMLPGLKPSGLSFTETRGRSPRLPGLSVHFDVLTAVLQRQQSAGQ